MVIPRWMRKKASAKKIFVRASAVSLLTRATQLLEHEFNEKHNEVDVNEDNDFVAGASRFFFGQRNVTLFQSRHCDSNHANRYTL
jgi:hypothetical protein